MKNAACLSIAVVAAMLLCSCATVPNGGSYGDITDLGTPGPVLASFQVGEGMLVQTVKVADDTEINIQINEDRDENDPLLFDNVLTIGKFSKILGSGFTSKKNIFYRKRIHNSGKDLFKADGETYMIEWACDYKDARTYLVSDHYTVSLRRFTKRNKTPDPVNDSSPSGQDQD